MPHGSLPPCGEGSGSRVGGSHGTAPLGWPKAATGWVWLDPGVSPRIKCGDGTTPGWGGEDAAGEKRRRWIGGCGMEHHVRGLRLDAAQPGAKKRPGISPGPDFGALVPAAYSAACREMTVTPSRSVSTRPVPSLVM